MKLTKRWTCLLPAVALLGLSLAAETRFVPRDFPRIKSAVIAACDGDIIEVDDGYYFEDNIVIDKSLTLRARNPYRAVIYGSSASLKTQAIFVIRAAADVEGFVLKNGFNGLIQRESSDVAWTARNLAIFNMQGSAVSINDAEKNVGRGRFSNIIIDHCGIGFETNDAHGMDVSNCLISNCSAAFCGFDHIYFRVADTAVWACRGSYSENDFPLVPPRTNAIERGAGVTVLDSPPGPGGGRGSGLGTGDLIPQLKSIQKEAIWSCEINRGMILTIAGDVCCSFNECRQALAFYEAALRLGHQSGSEEIVWRSHSGLAQAYEKRGDNASALENYRQVVSVIEGLRSNLVGWFFNPGFYADKMETYVSLINLLYKMHLKSSDKAYLAEAFAFLEMSKARALLDSLAETRSYSLRRASPEARAEQERIYRIISHLQIQLQQAGLSAARRARLLSDLEKAEHSYRDILLSLSRENRASGGLYRPPPAGYPEICEKILTDDTAVVEFILGQSHSFAFLATRQGISLAVLPPAAEIQVLVRNYLRFLSLRETKTFRAHHGGQRLNDILLGAFSRQLSNGIKKIIIVPDGVLFYLPFEALVEGHAADRDTGRPPAEARFLVETYEFSYAPSASALIRLMERKRSQAEGDMDLLAIGVSKPPALRNLVTGRPYDLPALRHARREIEVIGQYFPEENRTVLLDDEAGENALRRLDWSAYRIIHFAVHGLFDDEDWQRSGLLLKNDRDLEEDGFFQLRDIVGLNLGSDLVVLSSCQSGKGKIESGEGLLGLANAFLAAGSRSVLVSLWSIVDQSTAEFMTSFYGSLASGLPIARALREAKTKMIHSKYGHPFYWAPFVLVGEPELYSSSK
jgi:CHAT domain-containing protein